MNRVFYIEKKDIISEIMILFNKVKRRKINIKLNMGEVIYFEEPDTFLYTKNGGYDWYRMDKLSYPELILILKYFRNIINSEDIKSENTLYDLDYNFTKKRVMVMPINQKEVRELLRTHLRNGRPLVKRKRNVKDDKIELVKNAILKELKITMHFFPQHTLNLSYDTENNCFIFETNSVENDAFISNVIITMDELRNEYHYDCYLKKI